MMRLLCSALAGLLLSCASTNPVSGTAMFAYDDFGPPVVARELIGMDWWQWQAAGDPRPRQYDIKVVVYKDMPLEDVKREFPTDPSSKQDFRYVEYGAAIEYLDRLIQENVVESLTSKLADTKARIQKAF